jgi:hypothetical protein
MMVLLISFDIIFSTGMIGYATGNGPGISFACLFRQLSG